MWIKDVKIRSYIVEYGRWKDYVMRGVQDRGWNEIAAGHVDSADSAIIYVWMMRILSACSKLPNYSINI